ncbi:hypothetical protein [Burkholderia sp. Ac-20379]|uniref:hypothetical protein n=1 Tax=Burkholderia sp. Ac-20379 TaxID=2703900 RepID=UPI001981E4E0|nr:hypothetical protein [Burkholderia sp. Ac-20379]MBN3723054.1 hypothetical protein [Burkholderia sp. Ac-20379]
MNAINEAAPVAPSTAARTPAQAVTPYRAVLQHPTSALAGHAGDHPDVGTSAILGYN